MRALLLLLLWLPLSACLVYTEDGVPDDDDTSDDDDTGDDDTVDDDDTTTTDDADGDGVTAAEGDCDDGDPLVYPDAPERCNELDDDCDGAVDEGAPTSAFRPDADGDGYVSSDPGTALQACTAPDGYGAELEPYDCADSLSAVNPGQDEVCNGLDDDCDFAVDEEVLVPLFNDDDDDGYGVGNGLGTGCPGPGYASVGGDCDDSDPALSPADSDSDGVSSCDGDCDDADGAIYPGADNDSDGYGACGADCDDWDWDINPGAAETCDGLDQDCDGLIDEGLSSVAVIHGASLPAANQVSNTLSSSGYCVLPLFDVTNLSSTTDLGAASLVVATHDTGNGSGWYGDASPVIDWYANLPAGTAAGVVGMGLGGMGLLQAIGQESSYTLGNLYQVSTGTVYQANASNSFWYTPNSFTSAVTVHTQSNASARVLSSTSSNVQVFGIQSAAGGGRMITRSPFSGGSGLYLWAFDQGLDQASTMGRALFENLATHAIGPP